jgi:hypothetical protein
MCLPRCLRGLMRSLSKSVRGLLRCTSPVVAQSGEGQGVEFTSAFGGVAEVHGRTASAAFDANDPNRTSALRSGHPQFRCCLCLPARLFSSPQNSCAPSAVNQYVAPTGGVSASHKCNVCPRSPSCEHRNGSRTCGGARPHGTLLCRESKPVMKTKSLNLKFTIHAPRSVR